MPSGPRKIELLLRFLRAQNLWNRRRQAKAGVRALQTRLAAPQPGLARVHICLNRTVTAERLQTRTASALVAQAARFCSGPDQADPRPHDPAGQSRKAGMGATAPRIKLTRIGSDTDLSGATRTGCTDEHRPGPGASRRRDCWGGPRSRSPPEPVIMACILATGGRCGDGGPCPARPPAWLFVFACARAHARTGMCARKCSAERAFGGVSARNHTGAGRSGLPGRWGSGRNALVSHGGDEQIL